MAKNDSSFHQQMLEMFIHNEKPEIKIIAH